MDLISIDSLGDEDISGLIARALELFDQVRGGSVTRTLSGEILFNLFYENSTRTLMSFATAAHRLGMDVITLPVERSSVAKGENLADTARTLDAMRPDALVIRHPDNDAPAEVAAIMHAPVINAGDGTNEHPTQALLDAATLVRHFGSLEGRTVAICGDIKHSRVARSNAKLLPRLGATVRLSGPPALTPEGSDPLAIDDAIAGADAVMMLRVQRERMSEDLGDVLGGYLDAHGLNRERLAKAAPGAVVLHPGPMNRGVEIEDAVADDPERSLISLQVEMGVAMRMACLELLVGRSEA